MAISWHCSVLGQVCLLCHNVVLCPGAPEGTTSSGSGLKCLRRDHSYSHPKDWESQGSNSGPLGTWQMVYPLHRGNKVQNFQNPELKKFKSLNLHAYKISTT